MKPINKELVGELLKALDIGDKEFITNKAVELYNTPIEEYYMTFKYLKECFTTDYMRIGDALVDCQPVDKLKFFGNLAFSEGTEPRFTHSQHAELIDICREYHKTATPFIEVTEGELKYRTYKED